MNGRPATGSIAFGSAGPVTSAMRVPRPPARIATGSIWRSSGDDELRTLVVEAEAHFMESEGGHGAAYLGLRFGVEQEEAAASSANQLPPRGPSVEPGGDPGVDPLVGRCG